MEGPLDVHPSLDGYRFMYAIGRGGFGLVKLAWHLASGKYVAVKILLQDGSPSSSLSAQGEVVILRSLWHDNIMRLLEKRHTETHLFLVMELAARGSLYHYVQEQDGLAEDEARALFGQALAAVSYCHGQRVAHWDLKLDNLLLDEHMNIKLADFRLSLRLEQGTLDSHSRRGALLPAPPPTPPKSPASHSRRGALLPAPPPSQPPRCRPPAPVPGAVWTSQSQKPPQLPVSLRGLGPQPPLTPQTPQPAPRARGRASAGLAGGSSGSC
ncbi:MAP/microtubule affinity-regulating kinase 3 isoform X2 [Oryctolagus cuniculus]|uniref:MAP/microtubule affinity-regulating kinase 3 isoform X2 n=1 Tax=Oryctolagus cuniculus TaxID=9986 RepID=UPI0038796AE7